MSILNKIWITNISSNLASISLESLFTDEGYRIKANSHIVAEKDCDDRHVVHLAAFSDLDLFRIKVEIEKYLYERDQK